MFQTFSGSSRRPRQVNLSGRRPQTTAIPGQNTGRQEALKHAQQDRANRQRQRQENVAAEQIQRTWRGHSSRQKTRQQWRCQWDDLVQPFNDNAHVIPSPDQSRAALSLLRLFFDSQNDSDLERLTKYATFRISPPQHHSTADKDTRLAASQLADLCIAALSSSVGARFATVNADQFLRLLANTLVHVPGWAPTRADSFFGTMSRLLASGLRTEHLFQVLLSPFQNVPVSSILYESLVRELLSKPQSSLDLDRLSDVLDFHPLLQAVAKEAKCDSFRHGHQRSSSSIWLMANFIYLHKSTHSPARDSAAIDLTPISASVFAIHLAALHPSIATGDPLVDMENDEYDREILSQGTTRKPLNTFLGHQLKRLYAKQTLRSLFEYPLVDASPPAQARPIANYVISLFHAFPSQASEIRIQLSHSRPRFHDSTSLSATSFLWRAVQMTSVCNDIAKDPFNAARDLARYAVPEQISRSSFNLGVHDEFRLIILFLDLYTFILPFIDDEEFLGNSRLEDDSFRSNPLSLTDLNLLVTFLKHMGFALYYLKDQVEQVISSHGHPPKLKWITRLTTALVKALYERDARRHFLDKDRWLMSEKIDLLSFVKDAIYEEEQHQDPIHVDDADSDMEVDEGNHEEAAEDIFFGPEVDDPFEHLFSHRHHGSYRRPSYNRDHQPRPTTPRWEILQHMPFLLPFETRVTIFRLCVELDMKSRRLGHTDADLWRNAVLYAHEGNSAYLETHHAKVRRKHEFEDAYEQLYDLSNRLKEPLQITFVDEFDIAEAGIDGGGVTKEFLTNATAEAFAPEAGLFISNSRYLLSPSPTSVDVVRESEAKMGYDEHSAHYKLAVTELCRRYEFLGRVVGKCLYEGILVDITFAGFFLLKWCEGDASSISHRSPKGQMATRHPLSLNELRDYDEDLYQGLHYLKTHSNEAEDLGLTFSVTHEIKLADGTPKVIEKPIIANGTDVPVNKSNYATYITRMARYRLAEQTELQTRHFLAGLHAMINPHWLSMFNQSEIQTLIGGTASSINVADLRRSTHYGGVYVVGDDGLEHPSVLHFWNVMDSLPDADRRKVLKFVTSTPRAPLLGFSSLNPRFSIRDSGDDQSRFPTTSTCVNLLKLPRYEREDTLREKLLYAVNLNAGFDLS